MKSLVFCVFFAPIYAQFPAENWDNEMIEVVKPEKSAVLMSAETLYEEKWNLLKQPVFWKKIMELSPDSSYINVAETRQILYKVHTREWYKKPDAERYKILISLKAGHKLGEEDKLLCTSGKNHFYKFDIVYPSLTKGILAFEQYGVDPWYAQSILLIESPGQLLKSNVGAYGPFQLMPGVARNYGLKVSKYYDERADFHRSAYAAASLIKKICIPYAKKILNEAEIPFNETDLWFRLFVMHVYHAGSGNVKAVVQKIGHVGNGNELIQKMWQTEAKGFGNASQNYSQLVLAAQIKLHEMIENDAVKLFDCASSN